MNQRLSAASAISSLSRRYKWADPGPKLLAALVMVICLAVTYIAWQYAAQDVVHDLKSDFDYRARETVIRIEQRMGVYAQILRGAQGMLAASDGIKREQFHTYVASLQIEKNYPGIQGVGVVLQLPAAEKTNRIAEVWQLGSPDYSTWPDKSRATFSSIVQFEPATDQNRRAIGYDMFSEPIRRAAMEQARDSGQIGITGKVRLVQEKEPGVQPGVVMYLPIYRKGTPNHTVAERRANIVGWVFASFRMSDLMAKLNGESSEEIDIVIFDGETISPETMIYDTDDDAFTLDPGIPLLKALRRIDIAGRTWTIALHSMPSFEARSQGINPMLVAGSGIFLSLLMAALTYLLAAGRMRARVIAAEMMEELRESEEVWKFALEGAKDGVWDWNVSTGLVRFSTGWKEMLGYKEAEIGNNFDEWRKRAHPEDLARVMTDLEAYFTGKSANYINEHRLLCKDGSWKWILTRGMVVSRTEYGQLLRVVGTHADITERKKAEQRERRLKDLYRALSASNEAILRMESAAELFPLVCRIAVEYGGVMHAWVGVPDSEGWFATEASHGKVLNFVNGLTVQSRPEAPEGRGPAGTAFREGHPVIVNEVRCSEITSYWSVQAEENGINAVAAYPIMRGGKSFAIFVVYSDQIDAFDEEIVQMLVEMTANISFALDNFDREAMRRQAEGSLRASEEKFRTLFENAGDGISIVDKTGHFIDVNDLFAIMMGCSREEVLELGVADFIAQPEMVRVKEEMELLKKGMPLSTEYQSVRKDGTVFAGELNARLMPDGHMIGILRDITERRKTEEKLRLAALVYQNAREAMMVTDADGTIIDVNPAFTKLTGYEREEIAGENPRILKSGQHDNSFYEAMWRSITTNGQWQGEIWNRRKDGMIYPERLSINTVFNPDGTVCRYVAMFHDLTKEKESEEIIRALSANHVSVREEERKRIAREIHDDLGQRLSLLRMDVLMLPKAVGDNGEGLTKAVARMRDDIDNCIGIARNIVSDLRPAALDFGIVPAIEWLLDEFEARTRIKCFFHDLTEGEPLLNDQQATGLFRILQESLTNVAKHANAGQVEVELESLEDCLCLEIADNGVGIDPERIRNPNSYGLIGLRERAAMLGCELMVSSLRGQGTTVRICIPLHSCASPSCSRIKQ